MKAPESRRRSRSNDGYRTQVGHTLPEIVNAALYASCVEVIERHGPRIFHGPKTPRGSPPVVLSDEQVLELRRMRDWHGLTVRQIAKATGLTANSIEPITSYRNRVHLDPGPRPTPEAA